MAKQSILDMLKAADIGEMKTELQELEGKLEIATRQFKSDIDALKLSIKLAEVAQNGKPEKKPRAKKAPKDASSTTANARAVEREPTIADRAEKYLEIHEEDTPGNIAKGIELRNPTSIYATLQSDARFLNTGRNTYRLKKYVQR